MQAWLIAVPMVISSWNVQNPLLSRFSCFIRSHLQEYSYHPVSLSLLRPLSLILLPSLHSSSYFFFTIASLSLSPTHPSYSWPVCTSSFWRLSHSSPSFNLGYFLHFSVLPSLSPAPSLSLSVPSFPSLSAHPFVSLLCPIHINIFLPFPFPTSPFRIHNLSHFLASSIFQWPCIHPFPHLSFFALCLHCVRRDWYYLVSVARLISGLWPLTHQLYSVSGKFSKKTVIQLIQRICIKGLGMVLE